MLLATPEIAGLLYKRRGGFGKFAPNAWQYRFFVITKEGVLQYFDTEIPDADHSDSKARGRLDLRSVVYEVITEPIEGAPTPHAFQLTVPNEEKWKLCADTKEDQARWCKVLNKFVNQDKAPAARGILSYTSDDELDRDRPNRANRRNTAAVAAPAPPPAPPVLPAVSDLRVETPHAVAAMSSATSSSKTVASALSKKRLKLTASGSGPKDSDQFELTLVLGIINICFLGIYLASSLFAVLFYVVLGNLVVAMTLKLRALRVLNKVLPSAASASGSPSQVYPQHPMAVREEMTAVEEGATTVVNSQSRSRNDGKIANASSGDTNDANEVGLGPGSLGSGGSSLQHSNSSNAVAPQHLGEQRPVAGGTYPEVKVDFRTAPAHTWTKIDASFFNVRVGPDYSRNKKKAPSGPALYEAFAVDIFCAKQRVDHAAARFQLPDTSSLDAQLPAHVPAIMVVQLQIPSEPPSMFSFSEDGPGWALLIYFMITEDTIRQLADNSSASPAVKLWSDWCEKAQTDKDMRARFKVINSCTNMEQLGFSSLIVSYNAKPILIRRTGSLFRGANYMEFDIHVHKFQNMAKQGIHQISSLCGNMYMQVGFVIEGKEDRELPETIFGCVAVNKPQESHADFIFDHE